MKDHARSVGRVWGRACAANRPPLPHPSPPASPGRIPQALRCGWPSVWWCGGCVTGRHGEARGGMRRVWSGVRGWPRQAWRTTTRGAEHVEGVSRRWEGFQGGVGGKRRRSKKVLMHPSAVFQIFFPLPSLSSFPFQFFYFFLYRIIEADYNGVIRTDNRPITVY